MKTIKVVVKKQFRDRYSGVTHKVGDKLTVTHARYREILRSGDYVTKETAANNTAAKPEKTPEKITEIKK